MKGSLTKALSEPRARPLLEWTPDSRRSAIALADSGDLRLAADLCEAMLGDDRISGCLATRVRGLLGLPLTFEEGTGRQRRRTQAVHALEAEEDFWAAYPEPDLTNLMNWAVLLGIGIAEQVWYKRGTRVLPGLRIWHPRNFRYDWDRNQWMVMTADKGLIDVVPGDGKWLVIMPFGERRPWSFGLWRSLSLLWIAKYFAIFDWNRHNEVLGSPILAGVSPEGTPKELWEEFAADLSELGRGTAMALPPGFDAKLVEAQTEAHKTFLELIRWADESAAITILGQNLTTKIAAGSMAAARIHQEIRGDIIRADAETLSTCLHEQSLRFYAEFNWGAPELAPWPVWNVASPEDKQAKAIALQTFATAVSTLKQANVPLDVTRICADYDVPLIEGIDANAPTAADDPMPMKPGVYAEKPETDSLPNTAGSQQAQPPEPKETRT